MIVLDNASSDGSVAAIEGELGNRVKLISLPDNVGFAEGNNIAAEKAKGSKMLLLNPDTLVLDNAIDKIVEFSHHYPDSGIWGGQTVFQDGNLNPASCWSRQTLWSLAAQALGLTVVFRNSSIFNPEALGGWKRDTVRHVDIVSGCFLLIDSVLWERLGGFNREYFMYGEDADLCLRAKSVGAKPLICPDAKIVHYGGASENVRADKIIRLLMAKSILIDSHFSPRTTNLAKLLLFGWPLNRYLIHSFLALTGNRKSAGIRETWGEVINRKNEWAI